MCVLGLQHASPGVLYDSLTVVRLWLADARVGSMSPTSKSLRGATSIVSAETRVLSGVTHHVFRGHLSGRAFKEQNSAGAQYLNEVHGYEQHLQITSACHV